MGEGRLELLEKELDVAPFVSMHFTLEKIQEAMDLILSGAPVMKILIDLRP